MSGMDGEIRAQGQKLRRESEANSPHGRVRVFSAQEHKTSRKLEKEESDEIMKIHENSERN